ncbi:hypothetical protein D3C76_1354630 [compost metagenome]
MKSFEVTPVQDISCGAHYLLQNIHVAFFGGNQVWATRWRNLLRKSKSIANMLIHRNPTWGRCSDAAAFGAVLDIDLAEVFSLSA